MSHIETIGEDEATGATAELYAAERAAMGFLPRYTQALGARPEVYAAWKGLVGAVATGMDPRRYELVTLAAARELRSTYCSVAHGVVVLRDDLLPADDLLKLAGGDPAALDATDRAITAFATRVARAAADVTPDDVDALRAHGLADGEILDIVLAVAARCFFSTVLDATGTRADPELAGRLAPELAAALTYGRPVADA